MAATKGRVDGSQAGGWEGGAGQHGAERGEESFPLPSNKQQDYILSPVTSVPSEVLNNVKLFGQAVDVSYPLHSGHHGVRECEQQGNPLSQVLHPL